MTQDLEKLISDNQQVDRAALEKAILANKALKERGVTPKGYGLRIPYQRQVRGTVRIVKSTARRDCST